MCTWSVSWSLLATLLSLDGRLIAASSYLVAYTGSDDQPAFASTASLYAIDVETATTAFVTNYNNGFVIDEPTGDVCHQSAGGKLALSNNVVVGMPDAMSSAPLLVQSTNSWCDSGVSGLWGLTSLTASTDLLPFAAFASLYNESSGSYSFSMGVLSVSPEANSEIPADFDIKLSWNQDTDTGGDYLACAMQSGDQEIVAVDNTNGLLYVVCGERDPNHGNEAGQVLVTVDVSSPKWSIVAYQALSGDLYFVHVLGVASEGAIVGTAGWGNGTIGIGLLDPASGQWQPNMTLYPMVNHGPAFAFDAASNSVYVWDAAPASEVDGTTVLGKVDLRTASVDFVDAAAANNIQVVDMVFLESCEFCTPTGTANDCGSYSLGLSFCAAVVGATLLG